MIVLLLLVCSLLDAFPVYEDLSLDLADPPTLRPHHHHHRKHHRRHKKRRSLSSKEGETNNNRRVIQ
ncbi:unnamed protein product, partial [Mesorhabditis spiculigera]